MYSAIQMSLAGADPTHIASQLGKKSSQIKTLIASEWAQAEITNWHQAVMSATMKDRVDPIRRFQALVDKAITKVEQKMDCGDDKTELAAAVRILDNAGLGIVKRVEVSEDAQLRDLTPEELEYVATHHGQLPARKALLSAVAYAED